MAHTCVVHARGQESRSFEAVMWRVKGCRSLLKCGHALVAGSLCAGVGACVWVLAVFWESSVLPALQYFTSGDFRQATLTESVTLTRSREIFYSLYKTLLFCVDTDSSV